jgi:hypothetical protein
MAAVPTTMLAMAKILIQLVDQERFLCTLTDSLTEERLKWSSGNCGKAIVAWCS